MRNVPLFFTLFCVVADVIVYWSPFSRLDNLDLHNVLEENYQINKADKLSLQWTKHQGYKCVHNLLPRSPNETFQDPVYFLNSSVLLFLSSIVILCIRPVPLMQGQAFVIKIESQLVYTESSLGFYLSTAFLGLQVLMSIY